MEITKELFGHFEGKDVYEYTLTNDNGVKLSAIPYGATVTKIVTPDKNGEMKNITLNVDNLDDIVANRPYYGATIGRIAGRIAKGQYKLGGVTHQLAVNEGENLLHGGPEGFDTQLWDVEEVTSETEAKLIFTYEDPAGKNEFPGTMQLKVTFTLTNKDEWVIDYEATTDATTLYNPTNHVYFNLTGDVKQTILDHELQIASDYYGSLNEETLPTGKLEKSTGTPFDFSAAKPVKEAVLSDHPQIKPINGLDHPFVLNQKEDVKVVLFDPESGREVKVFTDMNSVVVFTHNGEIDDYLIEGEPAKQYAGLTLETQMLPDAINQPGFGNIILRPNETFHSQTTYQFGVRD